MSNKETLQSYNTRLLTNNNTITNINSLLKNLPKITEDLTEELTTYDISLTTQETSIQDIISALEGKASGGSQPVLQEKVVIYEDIEETMIITPDEGYDGLSSVKIKLGQGIDDYQEVTYIQTTSITNGTNFIDTGVIANNNTSLEMKFTYTNGNTNYSRLYYSGDGNTFGALAASQNGSKTLFFWGPSGSYKQGWDNGTLVDTIFKQAKNELYVNGNLAQTWDYVEWQNTTSVRLFSQAGGDRDGWVRIYYCKIWDGDTLIRDFMPCYRKADGVIGMYDRVHDKFYKNGGTGSFAKGTDV